MTIEQFRNSELSGQLAELLKNPVLAAALQVCNEASPSNGGLKEWAEPHHALIQLGVDRGYNLYPLVLKTLSAGVIKNSEPVEATYEEPEKEEE